MTNPTDIARTLSLRDWPALTDEQSEALLAFEDRYRVAAEGWRERLNTFWMNGRDASEPMGHALRQVRNTFGPSWLVDLYAPLWQPTPGPWERAVWVGEGRERDVAPTQVEGAARWSGDTDPPALGTVVNVRSWGLGTVTGYFIEHGWLGLIVNLHNPDEERRKGRGPHVHVFGAEFQAEAVQ